MALTGDGPAVEAAVRSLDEVTVDGAPTRIVVTAGAGDARDDLHGLRRVLVIGGDARAAIPLRELATIEIASQPREIRRLDLQRTVTVTLTHPPLALLSIRETVTEALSGIELPEGASVRVEP